MKRTVIGVFDRFADAQRATERLSALGIERDRIHLRPDEAPPRGAEPDSEALDGIRSFFAEIFGPDVSADDPRHYTEAIRGGNIVVAVEVRAESELAEVRQTLRSCGASRVGGSRPEAAGADAADDDASPELQHCIEACRACHKTCLQMAMHRCLEAGGEYVEPERFRLLVNCAEICHTAANFMISRSHLHPLLCGVCAEVCAECARGCEELGGMDGCAEACRDCGERCRRIAAAAA